MVKKELWKHQNMGFQFNKRHNIFVAGLTGTGRNSYSYLVAKEFAEKEIHQRIGVMYTISKPKIT